MNFPRPLELDKYDMYDMYTRMPLTEKRLNVAYRYIVVCDMRFHDLYIYVCYRNILRNAYRRKDRIHFYLKIKKRRNIERDRTIIKCLQYIYMSYNSQLVFKLKSRR